MRSAPRDDLRYLQYVLCEALCSSQTFQFSREVLKEDFRVGLKDLDGRRSLSASSTLSLRFT